MFGFSVWNFFWDFLFEIFCLDFLIRDKNVLFALYVRGWVLVGPHTHLNPPDRGKDKGDLPQGQRNHEL